MFSEYASRFLSQSRSRLSDFVGNEATGDTSTRRNEWQSRTARNPTRSYLQANPYNPSASRFGNLPFASRAGGRHDAPLFHSTLDEFREEEDEEERGRDAADLYALQHSRRVFAAGRLEESTEDENELSRVSVDDSRDDGSHLSQDRGLRLGIRSSWKGTRSSFGVRRERQETARLLDGTREGSDSDESKGKMVDVGLESTIMNEPPADLTAEVESSPPPFQKFRDQNPRPGDSPLDPELGIPRRSSISSTDEPGAPAAEEPPSNGELFKYDTFFAWLYIVAIASLFATFLLIWLHTSTQTGGKKNPWGDTIYTTLKASFNLLAVDTLVAVVVSILWLGALRSFMKPLVGLVVVAVPIIMLSFSLYPFISSFGGENGGHSSQDIAMRWSSLVPAMGVILWFYLIHRSRHAIKQAIEILEFSTKILAANPALILAGMGTLVLVVIWTWVWLAMFTRVFLGGHLAKSISKFIINASSWWLAVYFVLTYLWTLSVISAVQRGTTAATVSQWYFHRNVQPAPSSRDIVGAALAHSVTTIFGTICEATLLALLIRLPLLILPRRVGNIVQMLAYSFIPTPIATLTNPLAITYAGIHSQPLVPSARGLTEMDFLSPNAPTTTLTPRAFSNKRRHSVPLLPYRLAKLLLHATRFIMATALGFAGWVMTARQLQITLPNGNSLRGSAYAYVVGLVASFIGWGVLGAMEGVLSGIVDGVVVCYGSERRMISGQGGYCYEAAVLFGDDKGAVRNARRESRY